MKRSAAILPAIFCSAATAFAGMVRELPEIHVVHGGVPVRVAEVTALVPGEHVLRNAASQGETVDADAMRGLSCGIALSWDARAARANEIEAARRRIRREMLQKMPQQKLDPAKAEDRETYLAQALEKMWWEPAKVQMTAAVREWDDLDRLLDECDAAWPGVRALAKPVPHRYELAKKEE